MVKREELFCGGDFVDYRLRGRTRIGGSEDWAAHDEKIGAGTNRLLGRSFPRLIVGCGLHVGVFWPHAGGDDEKAVTARFANGFGFLNGSYHAIHSSFFGKQCKFDDPRLRRAADTDFFHCFMVHAGENRDG